MNQQNSTARITLMIMIILIIWLVIDINHTSTARDRIKNKKFWISTTIAILMGLWVIGGRSVLIAIKNHAQQQRLNVQPIMNNH